MSRAAQRYQASLALRQSLDDRLGVIDIVAGTAALALARDGLDDAVQLLAAAVTWAQELGYALDAKVTPPPRELAALMQRRLAAARFHDAWDRGVGMTPHDASQLTETVLAVLATAAAADGIAGQPRPITPVPAPRPPKSPVALTRREREVLALLCQRLTDAEIAAQLFISPRTASLHVSNILAKIDAPNRREAAAIAVRQQLV
jgi:DNA-binding CsgD family transcriptional regulator